MKKKISKNEENLGSKRFKANNFDIEENSLKKMMNYYSRRLNFSKIKFTKKKTSFNFHHPKMKRKNIIKKGYQKTHVLVFITMSLEIKKNIKVAMQ